MFQDPLFRLIAGLSGQLVRRSYIITILTINLLRMPLRRELGMLLTASGGDTSVSHETSPALLCTTHPSPFSGSPSAGALPCHEVLQLRSQTRPLALECQPTSAIGRRCSRLRFPGLTHKWCQGEPCGHHSARAWLRPSGRPGKICAASGQSLQKERNLSSSGQEPVETHPTATPSRTIPSTFGVCPVGLTCADGQYPKRSRSLHFGRNQGTRSIRVASRLCHYLLRPCRCPSPCLFFCLGMSTPSVLTNHMTSTTSTAFLNRCTGVLSQTLPMLVGTLA